jgi:hypothetical protein
LHRPARDAGSSEILLNERVDLGIVKTSGINHFAILADEHGGGKTDYAVSLRRFIAILKYRKFRTSRFYEEVYQLRRVSHIYGQKLKIALLVLLVNSIHLWHAVLARTAMKDPEIKKHDLTSQS